MIKRLLPTLLLAALSAHASEWLDVGALGPDRMFYDRSKLYMEGNTVSYWRRVEFRMPFATEAGLAYSALYRERIDCRDRTLATLGFLFYTDDNRVLRNVYLPNAAAVPIVPESVAAQFASALCPQVAAQRAEAEPQADLKTPELRKLEDDLRTLEEAIQRLRDAGKPAPTSPPQGSW